MAVGHHQDALRVMPGEVGMSALPTAISVIVCTRDRSESCAQTIARILETRPAGTELIVIDQSRDGDTLAALSRLEGFDSVAYVRSESRGLSAARNLGADLAAGEVLVYTDDDCLPEPGWVEAWHQCLAEDAGIGVGFGQVSCPPFDPLKGYTAGFNTRDGSHGLELFRLGAGQVGMGANMALPKAVWRSIGGFDEGLGAGTRFPAGEDADFAYRVVRAGFHIRHLSAARVWHYGYRQGAGASTLMRGYVAGIAAMYAKHARCGDAEAFRLLVSELGHHGAGVTRRLLSRTRPLGVMGMLYFLRGLGSAWTSPMDAGRRLYGSKDAVHAH
jgi:glycosyltransferase involved in cell wall biosynthesis